MSSFIIAFFMASGAAAWIYSKTQERTGNDTASSTKLAVIVGVIAFIVTLTVISIVGNSLEDI